MTIYIPKYLEEIRAIQSSLLLYIENEDYNEQNFEDFNQLIFDLKIRERPHEFKLLLRLLSCISQNNHHCSIFFDKIEKILFSFKEEMLKYFKNTEIFNIFKNNKRILLYLIEKQIIIIDSFVSTKIINEGANYQAYFSPEIGSSKKSSEVKKIDINDEFEENRKNGENENYICKLIRKDSVEEFISYVNRTNLSLNSIIQTSIFETNSFLIKSKKASLIEYAAFFGSIQIFQYLRLNNVDLKPTLWFFAIHGKNSELIHLLEENHVEPEDKTFIQILIESIKCHHNDIANYILNVYSKNDKSCAQTIFYSSLKYYNFALIQDEYVNQYAFYFLCKFDYYSIVYFLLQDEKTYINMSTIFYCFM